MFDRMASIYSSDGMKFCNWETIALYASYDSKGVLVLEGVATLLKLNLKMLVRSEAHIKDLLKQMK
jgi:hypothetical protein